MNASTIYLVRMAAQRQPAPIIRASWMSSYSRILDLGGAPSSASDSSPIRLANASKNSKLQAVAFDFDLLTGSFEASQTPDTQDKAQPLSSASSSSSSLLSEALKNTVQPDFGMIQQMANLLNVKVDFSSTTKEEETTAATPSKRTQPLPQSGGGPAHDIRAKYASKLLKAGGGGLAGIELAKSEANESLKRGDAMGHLLARKNVVESQGSGPPATRWMAMTGTGKLLSLLTNRSIKIALLPRPGAGPNKEMHDFSRQLSDVEVDVVIEGKVDQSINLVMKTLMGELDISPHLVLLVSDRDDYISAARDLGMITCRHRLLNARRGNVTAHYNIETVPELQNVVNEINGISYR
jgi:hypothetical protein